MKSDKKPTTKKPAAKKAEARKPEAVKKPASSKIEKADRFAVIKTGGKQYVVREGKSYDFEKLTEEEGKDVVFEEVLLVSEGSVAKIGEPTVAGAKVTGKVISQFKDDKVTVLKYKAKKRYKRTYGHRQQKTKVEITKIA